MRKATFPVDMASEQKTILGMVSKRQLMYLLGSGALIYAYVPFIWNLFIGIHYIIAGLFSLLAALPVAGTALSCAFIYKSKQHMYLDRYLWVKFKGKHERGAWRRGHQPTKWAEEKLK